MELDGIGNSTNVMQVVVQPLSDILADYTKSSPELREAEVLSLFSVVFERLS